MNLCIRWKIQQNQVSRIEFFERQGDTYCYCSWINEIKIFIYEDNSNEEIVAMAAIWVVESARLKGINVTITEWQEIKEKEYN